MYEPDPAALVTWARVVVRTGGFWVLDSTQGEPGPCSGEAFYCRRQGLAPYPASDPATALSTTVTSEARMMNAVCFLYVAAFIVVILSCMSKAPLWLAVLLINIALLLGCLPLR